MGLIAFLVFGLVIGFIARALMPGRQSMGIIATALLGIGGAFLGGLVASLLGGYPVYELRTTGWIGSILGALAILGIFSAVSSNRQSLV